MTRKLLAIAAAVAALATYGSAAQACISCSYTPEVLKSGDGGHAVREAAPQKRERSYSEEKSERRNRPAKKLSTRESRSDEKEAKAAAPAPKVASQEKDEASNEHSAITTTGAAIANQVKAAVATPAKSGPQNENSTISTARAAASDKPIDTKAIEQATADKNVGCKKYFPSTGLTLTVPCE